MVRAGDREPVAGRVFGLDLLRALAIVLVVLVHCSPWQLGRIDGIGWLFRIDGVDLFFVLSGYLVG
ncbi:MAG TPA: acyltransferase family protein, partial [Flavobacteriales bacterium]|nr:acyltransferase family protein [Flavobacteriales bacterium]